MRGAGPGAVPQGPPGIELLHNPMYAHRGGREDGADQDAADAAPHVTVQIDETLDAEEATAAAAVSSASSLMEGVVPGTDILEQRRSSPRSLPFRKTFALYLHHTTAGHTWDVFQMLLSLAACIIYVMDTYGNRINPVVMQIVAVFFVMDYFMQWFAYPHWAYYPATPTAIVDAATILPEVLEIVSGSDTSLAFLRFVRVLRILRILRAFRKIGSAMSAINQQIFTLVLTICTIVFLSAGMVHVVEETMYESLMGTPRKDKLTFGSALYFVIVTITTVGYGDIAPQTPLGKLVVSVMITVSFVAIPMQLNKLTSLLALQSKYRTRFNARGGVPHVLVVGDVQNAVALRAFFTEFYHPDRLADSSGKSAHLRQAVIMGPDEPNEDVRAILNDPMLEHVVRYIKGSIMVESDLRRVRADAAEACVVLANKLPINLEDADAATVLRALVIENFNPDIRTVVQILSPRNKEALEQADVDTVVCIDELKMQVLAQNVLCPGFVTIFDNLCSTSADPDPSVQYQPWFLEYSNGRSLELYSVPLAPPLVGLPFRTAARRIYLSTGGTCLLVGVQEPLTPKQARAASSSGRSTFSSGDGGFAFVYVFPGDGYAIGPHTKAIVMAPDARDAAALQQTSLFRGLQDPVAQTGVWLADSAPEDVLSPPDDEYGVDTIPDDAPAPHLSATEESEADAPKGSRGSPAHMGVGLADGPSSPRIAPATGMISRTQSTRSLQAALPSLPQNLNGHILALGTVEHLDTLVASLFHHDLLNSQWMKEVVVLTTTCPPSLLELVDTHSNLYCLLGNPERVEDLEAAGISTASHCVLLSDRHTQRTVDGETLDTRTIFTFLAVENAVTTGEGARPDFHITVEASSLSNLRVLNAKRLKRAALEAAAREGHDGMSTWDEPDRARRRAFGLRSAADKNRVDFGQTSGRHVLPFFAAGYGFSTQVFDCFACQAFYNPPLRAFLEQLAAPPLRRPEGEPHPARMLPAPVPRNAEGWTMGDAFVYLLERGALVIGCYRAPTAERGNSLPYIAIGLPPHATLERGDSLFVLTQQLDDPWNRDPH